MKCPKCGEENPKTNRFCDNCGTKLGATENASAPVAVATAEKPAAPLKAPRRAAAVAATPGAFGGSWLDREFFVDREKFFYALVILFGAFLRLWMLGDKPLHHDESIHAWYSYKLFTDGGGAYKYDPAYHGPFLYHANALMYFIFGTSDFATRLLPAAFGIGMIWFLWKWRGFLGRTGALLAATFYAVSPTVTYVSRFIRDDIYMAVSCLVMVWSLFKFFEEPKPRYLYWFTAGLIVSFTSMEATWIFSGIFGSFLLARWVWELGNPVAEENHVHRLLHYVVDPQNRGVLYRMAAIFFIPFTILFTSMFFNADGWFIGLFDSLAYWMGEQKVSRADQPWFFYLCLLGLYEAGIVAFALVGGLRTFFGSGKPQLFIWKILGSGIPFLIAFWILVTNQKVPLLLPVMAGLVTLGSCVIAYCCFAPEKGNFFKVFLLYWSILALWMFTLAGERMPWLTLHPLTPMTLLAGLYLGELFEREPGLAEQWIGLGVLAVPLSYFAFLSLRVLPNALWQMPRELASFARDMASGDRHGAPFRASGLALNLWESEGTIWRWLPLAAAAAVAAFLPFFLNSPRWSFLKRWTRAIWVGMFVAALAFLLHGTNNLLFYGDGANPAEQLVYVQSSTEIPKLRKKLEDMSIQLTGGLDMKIAVEDLCSWPLSWYLRDFEKHGAAQVGFHPPLLADQVKDFPVVITAFDTNPPASPDHDAKIQASFQDNYVSQRIKLREWWGPNKEAVLGANVPWSDTFSKVFKLFMYREPWGAPNPSNDPNFSKNGFGIQSPLGSYDMNVWVRKDVEKYFR
jgi:uncharacterized protein (TIGR03663 family)